MDRPKTTRVIEGHARLTVPVSDDVHAAAAKGPGKVEGGLFFNPAMRFNRDLSILVLEERAEASPSEYPFAIYDGLAATGARGIRLALECRPLGRPLTIHCNDRDTAAIGLLHENITDNAVGGQVTATADDFSQALGSARYHHIDVDPYGSPVPFLDAALRHLAAHATLALTATDVTALCGVFPNVALRRYDAVPWHGPGMHEVALRILAGTAVRHAARFDLALRPILAHATDHYVRVYLEGRRGAQRADDALTRIGHAVELADGTRTLQPRAAPRPADAARFAGPLWIGPLQDRVLVERLILRLDAHPQLDRPPLERFLQRALEEADAPPLVYEMGETAKRLRMSAPSMPRLFAALEAAGYSAHRTHVADDAFKTDAPGDAIAAAFRAANP